MNRNVLLVVIVGLVLLALASCTGAGLQQPAPTPSPLSLQPQIVAAPMQPLPTSTPRPPTAAPLGETPETTTEVRSGRMARDADVYAGPDLTANSPGSLTAGSRVIVTGASAGWLEIIFPAAPGGHAYSPRAAVDFDATQAEPTVGPDAASPAPTVEPAGSSEPVRQPAQSQPAAVAPRPAALPGKLVFQTGNGADIYLMNADGSGLRRLTYGFEPALSPDGRQVAFTRWDEPRGLWVINVDGSGERLLTGANRARSPTWSPDGQAIIFERDAGSATCLQSPFGCLGEGELLALFGGQPCLSTPFGSFCIADFAPVSRSATSLVRYDLASSTARDLPASQTATAPSHHPDSPEVLYLDRGSLALAQTVGNEPPRRLVQAPPLLAPATYSPDGRFIYAARNAGNRWDLWRWRVDGSEPSALTASDPLAARQANNVAPALSPDSKSVVFLTDRGGRWELYVMDSDGSNQRLLASQALAGITFVYDFNGDRTVHWGR